jgi:MinD-like ATPase involved in chromosome partitioning or flagellar assembly
LTVLSWSRDGVAAIPGDTLREVLQAAPRAADLVLVDLPPALGEGADATLAAADLVLVTCPADVRSAAAAARVVEAAAARCADVRLVLRTVPGQAVAAETLAEGLGIPLAGTVPTIRGLARAVDEGLGPPVRGRLGRAVRRLLATLPERVAP